jgi:hypothetical protein
MDPFLEGPHWLDFHNSFCVGLRAALTPRLLPRYTVRVEEELVLEAEEGHSRYVADVAVEDAGDRALASPAESDGGVTLQPVIVTMRRNEPIRAVYLEVLDRHSRRVITVIELLSPWNKASGGYEEYLLKRDDLPDGGVNLVEIDLLRAGRRLATVDRKPAGDNIALISRRE